jgi:hypothetical protein
MKKQTAPATAEKEGETLETATEPQAASPSTPIKLTNIEPNFVAHSIGMLDGLSYEFNSLSISLPNGKEQIITVALRNGAFAGFQSQILP